MYAFVLDARFNDVFATLIIRIMYGGMSDKYILFMYYIMKNKYQDTIRNCNIKEYDNEDDCRGFMVLFSYPV